MFARLCLIGGMLIGVQSLAGCDLPLDPGFSGVSAEQARLRADGYYVVSVGEDRAVVSAKGRQVAIKPAKGFCVASDSVEASRLSAFALIADCALDKAPDKSKRGARGELKLPRGVPGIITISVSGNPQLEEADSLEGMEAFLRTSDGLKLLGRGTDPFAVKVKEIRQIGDGIYVLVEDAGEGVLPVLSKRFWRGFVQVNERMAVVTVSGFRARPLGNDKMLQYLVDQVQTLTVANATPINEPQQVLVADAGTSEAGRVESGAVALTDLQPEPLEISVAKRPSLSKAPEPRRRPKPATVEKPTVIASAREEVATTTPIEPKPQLAATPAPEAAPSVELKNPAKSAPKRAAPAKKASRLAVARQAATPEARPSSNSKTKAATKLAPAKAPSAPKRPAV
ncbi:MAG: hypothetical protein AB8B85_03465 [Paracoccaceae bacterium]